MSVEDNDNLYVLNEEDEMDVKNDPLNFAAYEEIPDQEKEEEEEQKETGEKKSAVLLLFNIMFQPVEGWKELRRSKIPIERLQSGCFYPLLALLAIGNFADYIYTVNVSLPTVVTKAIVAFVSFFFAYFSIPVILSMFLPKTISEKLNGTYGKSYFIIGLSTLALFSFITELLPMIWPILIFLPIWTLYIMFKGVRFFHLQEKEEIKFFLFAGASVIGVPLLIDWVLNAIMPY